MRVIDEWCHPALEIAISTAVLEECDRHRSRTSIEDQIRQSDERYAELVHMLAQNGLLTPDQISGLIGTRYVVEAV